MQNLIEIVKGLPPAYEVAAYDTGAIKRNRKIHNAGELMLLCLFHLLNGCTLVEISEIARLTHIATLSDVAFMKRFEQCAAWFRWISMELLSKSMANYTKPTWLEKYQVLALDASEVKEKGRAGRFWRLHFILDIFSMSTYQYKITDIKCGETLTNFTFEKGQLVLADRAYATIKGISHCIQAGADFLMRIRKNCFTIYDANGHKIDLQSLLTELRKGESLDVSAFVHDTTQGATMRLPVRICAIKKPPEAVEQSRKKLERKESKNQTEISEETKLFNEYFVVVTSLPTTITVDQILAAYRYRWQVEIYFKRLKSLFEFGELPKRREGSVRSWLDGKMMLALLIENTIANQAKVGVFPPQGK